MISYFFDSQHKLGVSSTSTVPALTSKIKSAKVNKKSCEKTNTLFSFSSEIKLTFGNRRGECFVHFSS